MIPQVEAEKRGLVYDEKNQTYLFDLTSDCAIDALRKGNKTRFINHNVNPNLAPKILVVNGDFRIGFFAQKDIPAQTEVRNLNKCIFFFVLSSPRDLMWLFLLFLLHNKVIL